MTRLVIAIVLALGVAPAFAQSTTEPQPVEEGGRSGFWTSRRPAKGGAYRWRLLGIGGALVLVTGLIVIRVVKNTKPPTRP